MCFSVGASFAAAGVLLVLGSRAVHAVHIPSQYMLAAIPFLFALQQAAEGIVWATARRPGFEKFTLGATYLFLMFAFIVWPSWVPTSLWIHERDHVTKRGLIPFMLIGVAVSVTLAYWMIYYGVRASVECSHIDYMLAYDIPDLWRIGVTVLYILVTITPFFIAHNQGLHIFGALLGVSCFIAYYIWQRFFISIWCFFAALLSVALLVIIQHEDREINPKGYS
jgi:hypothetical protein